MALETIIRKLENTKKAFNNELPRIELQMARDIKSDIQDRIQEEGIQNETYSPGYLAYKKRRGKYRGKVDLTFTGDMWRTIDFKERQVKGKESVITIGATNQTTQEKIDDNEALYGEFLNPTPTEIQTAKEIYAIEIKNLIVNELRK